MTLNSVDPIIILGTGLAGYSLAKELRKIDKTRTLILITKDDGHFYSKPQLSTALSQHKTPQDLVITPADEMQNQLAATIYTFSTVEDIDPLAQTLSIQTPHGKQALHYDKLIFANGASPKQHPLLSHFPQCYQINHLEDYRHFIANIPHWQTLLIVGSGLVGCEFAYDLTKTSLNLHIITPDPYPLFGLVPKPVGQALQNALAQEGIVWHTLTHLREIKLDNDLNVLFDDGTQLQAQAILSAIGLSPNIQLAHRAQIKVNQGILVNDYLETSAPHVFALGDCAEINGICRQFIAPILPCARSLAQTLLGHRTPVSFPATPISLKVATYPIITFLPPKEIAGDWHFEITSDGIQCLFLDENERLQGYCLGGNAIETRQLCLKALGSIPNFA